MSDTAEAIDELERDGKKWFLPLTARLLVRLTTS